MDIQQLQLWHQADDAITAGSLTRALNLFHLLPASSRIEYNKAWLSYQLGKHTVAIEYIKESLALDRYLAIAYQLRAICYFKLAEQTLSSKKRLLNCAIKDSEKVLELLQDNMSIDYTQLDNPTVLHQSHILYNIALYHNLASNMALSIKSITEAFKIDTDQAIRAAYVSSVFLDAPLDLTDRFSVSKIKVSNMQKRRYMKGAKVVLNVRGSVGQSERMSCKSGGSLKDVDRVDELLMYYQVE